MTSDLLARIDELLTCYQCGELLAGSPSLDFCSEQCQADWHGSRVPTFGGGMLAAGTYHVRVRQITITPGDGCASRVLPGRQ